LEWTNVARTSSFLFKRKVAETVWESCRLSKTLLSAKIASLISSAAQLPRSFSRTT